MDLLKAENRDLSFSKGELMTLRKQGKIPSVIYDGKTASIPLFVNKSEFEKIYAANGNVFQLEVAGKKQMVNTEEIQKDPLGSVFMHIAFHKLTKGQKTVVNVQVQAIGEAPGVKEGGTISIVADSLALKVLPSKVPHYIEVDVSTLQMGEHILAKDIKLPEGAELDQQVDPETNVIMCSHPQKVVEEEVTTEAVVEPVAADEAKE